MDICNKNILIMAAGTGGHVFPALAVADELVARGANIFWLGTPTGMENELVARHHYPMHTIAMQGLRGKGFGRAIRLPVMLLSATRQAKKIIKTQHIDVAVGFGGYVSAPGGLACKLAKKKLIIHEQNAIAGMSNRQLARYADVVLQAFDGAFDGKAMDIQNEPHDSKINAHHRKIMTVGNPIRQAIENIADPDKRYNLADNSPLKVLVVGGSLGAMAINHAIVNLLQTNDKSSDKPLHIKHQCGKDNHATMQQAYANATIDPKHTVQLLPFIDDMAAAYAWADVVICRAGALTVSEIASVGVAAIFVPLPSAVDDHQRFNAQSLTKHGAGILLLQNELEKLPSIINNLTRTDCHAMAKKAKTFAKTCVAQKVADQIARVVA